jgi:hypothetical protein
MTFRSPLALIAVLVPVAAAFAVWPVSDEAAVRGPPLDAQSLSEPALSSAAGTGPDRYSGHGSQPPGESDQFRYTDRATPVARRRASAEQRLADLSVTAGPQQSTPDPRHDASIDRQLGRPPLPSPAVPTPAVQPDPGGRDLDASLGRQAADVKVSPGAIDPSLVYATLTLEKASADPLIWQFTYGRALRAVPVFDHPGAGGPRRTLDPTGRWVAITDQVSVDGELWYQLATGGWSPAATLELHALPTFRGIEIGTGTPDEFGFVVTDVLNVRPHAGVSDDNQPVAQLERHDAVAILQESAVDGETWLRIGDNLWVSSAYIRRPAWTDRPSGVDPDEKWIDVNLSRQMLVAYDGDRAVYATLVSSGLPRTPTWTGLSRIWVKHLWAKMAGGDRSIPGDYYWLEHVPYTMYFHWDFGLHGAYWHNDFGRQKSHGCVNLSPADAAWLFRWTDVTLPPGETVARPSAEDPGTWVWTHY